MKDLPQNGLTSTEHAHFLPEVTFPPLAEREKEKEKGEVGLLYPRGDWEWGMHAVTLERHNILVTH